MECMINDLPIYYEEHGKGKAILCLHGFTEDHRSMVGCLEPFFQNTFQSTEGYRRIYLDMPGMGKTPAKDWVKNADIMLDIIKKFISEVIGDEGFLLLGTSYGGYMALGLASDKNIKLDGIFLFGPCTVTNFEDRILPEVEDEDLYIEEGLEDTYEDNEDFDDFLEVAVIATEKTWRRYESEILPAYKIVDTNFTDKYRENGYAFSFEHQLKELQFAKPITILVGRQDESVGYEDAWNMLKHLPRLTYVALNFAGHLLHLEHEEVFYLHLQAWLKVAL